MEFREFVDIFIKDRKVFTGVMLGCGIAAALVFWFQREGYQATLVLNVTRAGSVETSEYRYDQFYRLQADERFADTVVRWLESPALKHAVDAEAPGQEGLIRKLKAVRLSSQMIEVTYEAASPQAFGKYATAITRVVNRESAKLNEQAKAADWFIVVAGDPVTRSTKVGLAPLVIGGLLTGIVLAFWTVLVRRYWKG